MPCDEHSLSRPVHLSTSLRAFFHTQFTIIIIIARANRAHGQSLVDGGGIVFVPLLLLRSCRIGLALSAANNEHSIWNIAESTDSFSIRDRTQIEADWYHERIKMDIPVSLLLISKWRSALAVASMAAAQFTYRRIFLHLKLASVNVAFCLVSKCERVCVCVSFAARVCFFFFVLQVCYFNKTKEREQ